MASETLDFTSWYELQADTDSDDERVSSNLALPYNHDSFSHRSIGLGGSRFEPQPASASVSSYRQSGQSNLIQQLLDEMDDANQKIDRYSGTKKSDGMSLEEYPIDSVSRSAKDRDDSGCDEVVSTAIAEVSKDFTTGNLSTGPLVSGESDESHLSSDNDFRHRRGASYARYPETAAGLSDNDWNPYVTESDTNTSPRLAGDLRPGVFSNNGDSKINSLASSFNPPLCSTKTGSASRISRGTPQMTTSRPASDGSFHLSDIKEHSGLSVRSISSLKPDTSLSPPQMTSSKLSEYSFEKQPHQPGTSLMQVREDATRNLKKCFERTSWPPSPEKTSGGVSQALGSSTRLVSRYGKPDSLNDQTNIEDNFRKLRSFGDGRDNHTWEIKSSLPGRGYFSDAVQSALSTDKVTSSTQRETATEMDSQKYKPVTSTIADHVSSKGSSYENRVVSTSKDSEKSGQTRLSRESEMLTSTTGSSTDTIVAAQVKMPSASSDSTHRDKLTQQVNKLLQETAYLTGSCRARDRESDKNSLSLDYDRLHREKQEGNTATSLDYDRLHRDKQGGNTATSLDYDRLHRDLQEIQDSLHTMGQSTSSPRQPTAAPPAGSKSDSDDGDIVPSTSTTPERARRLMWDYGADLGYRSGPLDNLEGMMSDITSESSPVDGRCGKQEKINYTSDGEETRTSSMDHAEEEEHNEDTSLTMTSQLEQAAAAVGGMDLEQLMSTFRTESRALEDRYQNVRSQGMADKVISILTSTKPDQQAEGILSQISAEEREHNLRRTSHGLGGGHLDTSSSLSNTFVGLKGDDSVRRRLDMSALSDSADSSCLLNSYLEANPKLEAMFSATTAAQSLISAQMKKMADRTFSHSLELRSPQRQEVQCYPVYSSQRDQPHHQQLQQQLQEQLQQKRREEQQAQGQQQQQQEQQQQQQKDQTKPKEAWTEKDKNPGTEKSPRDAEAEKFESLMAEVKARSRGEEEGSPSSVASPAESDKSSEMRRGKYRPYRPAGSQDVYYTESDTASVAESVTTVESTHTGSDDAVAPCFPGSLLGSRQTGVGGEPGLYARGSKTTGPGGPSAESHLPTIQERSISETPDRYLSDLSEKGTSKSSDTGLRGQGSRIPLPVGGSADLRQSVVHRPKPVSASTPEGDGGSGGISSVMAKQQARVESIVREKDSARKAPGSEASDVASHKEVPEQSRSAEGLDEVQETQSSQLLPSTSPDSLHRSRIPVRGSPPNYQAALRSKIQDTDPSGGLVADTEENTNANRQPSFTDRPGRSSEERPGVSQDIVVSTSEEDRLLQAIDAEVKAEIQNRKQKGSSPENSDDASARPQRELHAVRSHEDRPLLSGSDQFKLPAEGRLARETYLEPVDTMAGGGAWPRRSDPDTEQPEADSAIQRALESIEINEVARDKRQEEAEMARQQDQRIQQLAQAIQESLRKEADAERRALGQTDPKTKLHISGGQSMGAGDSVSQGKKEIKEAVTDKRREEAELEKRHLDAQIAKEREASQAMELARGQEIREAQARRQQVLAAAEARKEEGLQHERELRREMEREREIAAKLRREAEMHRESELRHQEELRREAEWRREQELQREAEIQRKAELLETELRKERERLREMALHRETASHKETASHWEADMHREAEQMTEAARTLEEVQSKEVDLVREMARKRQDPHWETERQREAEEAIERAGGGTVQEADKENDREVLPRRRELLARKDAEEAVDSQPMSHRVQILREALEQETAYQRPDLHILWERFMAGSNGGQEPDSSLNSEKVSMLTDLLRDPTQHLVHTFLSQRQRQHQEDEQRAAACRQTVRQTREEDHQVNEEERAALERELRRQQARRQQQRLSSEEESNGSYGEILQQRERDRLKRREVRTQRKKVGKSPSPSSSVSKLVSSDRARIEAGQGDTMETLYSIPEDLSLDVSPHKSRSPHRSHSHQRQEDVIDPHMDKLRRRIDQQRKKINKERVKEAHREEKLDKLKALLGAKRTGLLDDRAILAHLASISSTSAGSSDDTATVHSHTVLSDHTTTAKDSSTEMQRAKLANSPAANRLGRDRLSFRHTDLSMESEFTPLREDSSQTDTDFSGHQSEGQYGIGKSHSQSRRHPSSSYQPSRNGGRFVKMHQSYSPYKRQELIRPRGTMGSRKPSPLFERSLPGRARDIGTMYPSPKPLYLSHRKPHRSSRLISRAVQTSPDSRKRHVACSFSPPYERRSPVSWGSPKGTAKSRAGEVSVQVGKAGGRMLKHSGLSKLPRQSRSISPAFDSSQVAACLSPDRSRASSASPARSDTYRRRSPSPPRHRSYSPTGHRRSPPPTRHRSPSPTRHRSPTPTRHRSPSPVELRLKAWTERESRSPLRDPRFQPRTSPGRHQDKVSLQRRGKGYRLDAENRVPGRRRQQMTVPAPSGLTWFIPIKEDKPWRQPLKERQAFAASREDWRPTTLTQQQWKELARADLEGGGMGGGLRGSVEGDAARLYLHTATKEAERELGLQYDQFDDKPLCRMSLQEALMSRRPDFVSSLRQRQKRVKLAAENRQLQALVRAEQDRIFADQRLKNANPDAHPYSENLHQPKRRVFSKQEMKDMTEKIYKRLPEVKQMETEKRRSEDYRMNRLRAKLFNKRVQRKVLDKTSRRAC